MIATTQSIFRNITFFIRLLVCITGSTSITSRNIHVNWNVGGNWIFILSRSHIRGIFIFLPDIWELSSKQSVYNDNIVYTVEYKIR